MSDPKNAENDNTPEQPENASEPPVDAPKSIPESIEEQKAGAEPPQPEVKVEAAAETPSPDEEIASLKDRLLRTMADLENTRRRAEREKADAAQFGISRFARDVLGIADNLRRALDAVTAEDRAAAGEAVENLLSGVELTERELLNVLDKNGIKTVDPKGEKFNAHLHQAMAEIPGTGQPNGTIVDVVQVGYTIGERLLRPAMVTVAKGDESQPKPDQDGPGSTVNTTA